MKILKDKPIGKKLFITFAAILTLFTITVGVTLFSQLQMKRSYTYMSETVLTITNRVGGMRRDIQAAAKFIMYAATATSESDKVNYMEQAQVSLDSLSDGVDFLYENSTIDKSVIDNFNSNMENAAPFKEQIFGLLEQNQNVQAQELYFETYYQSLVKANDYLVQISDYTNQRADTVYRDVNRQIIVTFIVLGVIVVLTFTGTVYLGLYLAKCIKFPVREIEAAANRISKGELEGTVITYQERDEFGSLAESMRSTVQSLSNIIGDIDYLMSDMANGNFNIRTKHEASYVGEFSPILGSIRKMNQSLSSTLREITMSSDQVSAGSDNMAEASQSLAEGATEQAGAVEELLATVSSLAENLTQAAENSEKAYKISQKYADTANQSRHEMQNMVSTMGHISETSKSIEGIIAEIEEIASQTNLLSLNASIEAARAGEAGRGFAVVADQIGKLASESAQSAVNTRQLIVNILSEIETGSRTAEGTAKTIDDVVSGINEVAEYVKEISEKSQLQAASMQQAEDGVNQISGVVQSNSATAEESSATSEELSAQAENLKALVNQFELRTD